MYESLVRRLYKRLPKVLEICHSSISANILSTREPSGLSRYVFPGWAFPYWCSAKASKYFKTFSPYEMSLEVSQSFHIFVSWLILFSTWSKGKRSFACFSKHMLRCVFQWRFWHAKLQYATFSHLPHSFPPGSRQPGEWQSRQSTLCLISYFTL